MIKNEINWNVLYIPRCQFLKTLDCGETHQHMKTKIYLGSQCIYLRYENKETGHRSTRSIMANMKARKQTAKKKIYSKQKCMFAISAQVNE